METNKDHKPEKELAVVVDTFEILMLCYYQCGFRLMN